MLTVCIYQENSFKRLDDIQLADFDWPDGSNIWLDFDTSPDEDELAQLASRMSIHPIAIRSLFVEAHHPRMQEFPGQVYLGARAVIEDDAASADINLEHLGLFMGNRFLITVHAKSLPVLNHSRERLEANSGDVRSHGSDHLLYLILDGLVDDYYSAVDKMAEEIDDLDSRSDEQFDRHLQHDILESKRRLLILHKAITPLRDILLNLRRTDSPMFSHHTELYMRDIFEHVLQLLDTVDTYREVLSNTTELAMAAASNRMNEVMTVLTVISSFFIPLNFIVGYFGMNLMMPETNKPFTYPIVIGVMMLTVFFMVIWLKRKKWL